jgi:two-component system sensor histidine kinase KdpD
MTDVSRGELKVFLGYAAGSGKTYEMLSQGQELLRRGLDVVAGYFESHGRLDTIAKAEGLPVIPRRRVEYRGATFEEMDTAAILARRPEVCLVDELAHTNVPGSERAKRWQDVEVLLEAGINVYTTVNVQHLESLNGQVWQITGVRVRETIPDWVLANAAEVVMVDVTPRALLNRLERGAVYAPEKARRAMENFFQESHLVALRELALRQTAHEVDTRQAPAPGEGAQAGRASSERLLIHVSADPSSAELIRRGKRIADYVRAPCVAVAVCPTPGIESLPHAEREAVERHLNFARNLHVETRVLTGEDPAKALVEFAGLNQITQLFVARPRYSRFQLPLGLNLVHRVVRLARTIQVTVVAERHRR